MACIGSDRREQRPIGSCGCFDLTGRVSKRGFIGALTGTLNFPVIKMTIYGVHLTGTDVGRANSEIQDKEDKLAPATMQK